MVNRLELNGCPTGLVPERPAPSPEPVEGAPSVPPRKANSSKVDSAMRYWPRRALALSSPNTAKAMTLIAMRAAAMLVEVRKRSASWENPHQ